MEQQINYTTITIIMWFNFMIMDVLVERIYSDRIKGFFDRMLIGIGCLGYNAILTVFIAWSCLGGK